MMIFRLQLLACISMAFTIARGSNKCNDTIVPVVIDSDGGADDAFGLLLFLWKEASSDFLQKRSLSGRNERLKLVAVTSVIGNTGLQNATRNLRATLEIAGREDIPVHPGASDSILGKLQFDYFFGYDGFGDFLPPVHEQIVENEGVDALVGLSKKYDGSLVIICIGPLTNIALAQRKDPSFLHRVKHIYIMGGTVYGYGNIKPGVEFNAYSDPEAVDIVFRETPKIITVMPFDPVYLHEISKDWRENVLGKLNSTRMQFLNMAERKSLLRSSSWSSADPQAVATAIFPDLITKSILTRAVVETGGVHARGAMLIDHGAENTGVNLNVKMIQEININFYQRLLLQAFKD